MEVARDRVNRNSSPLFQMIETTPVIAMSSVQELQETAAAVAHLQVVSGQAAVVSRSPSPAPLPPPPREATPSPPPQQRLPSVLEAAIKAEPKVEVERLPSPPATSDDVTPQSRLDAGYGLPTIVSSQKNLFNNCLFSTCRLYAASTSRQNLETIVEAIRHLEGDQFISDEPTQEVPLALTTQHRERANGGGVKVEMNPIKVEMNPYLHFHSPRSVAAMQQQRPGVIVVKQST